MKKHILRREMQRRDEETRGMRWDEGEEGGGRRRRDGRRRALLANVVNEGKQHDLILTVPKSVAANRGVKGSKKAKRHNAQISKVRCYECRKAKRHNSKISKSRYCQSGGKQNDIILKFEKSHVVNICCQWRKAKRHNSQS